MNKYNIKKFVAVESKSRFVKMVSGNINPDYARSSSVKTYYRSIFDKCDEDKDGFVSLSELENFIRSHRNNHLPDDTLSPMVTNTYANSDLNHDEKLDFDEFIEMLSSPKFNRDFNNIGQRYIRLIVVPPNRKMLVLNRTTTCTGLFEDEARCKLHSAVGILLITLLQMIFFYVDQYGPQPNVIRDALMFCPSRKHEVWRYLTCMLVHHDELHLYFNLVIQLIFGIPLEMVHTWRVPVLYGAGVIGGTLFQAVIYPNEGLSGASAGVYSFSTAHIATVLLNWREMSNPLANLFVFGIFVIFDAVYSYVKFGNTGSTSYVAHLGGAICGLLVGVQILRNLRETPLERRIWWICMVLYVLLMGTFIISSFFVEPTQPFC